MRREKTEAIQNPPNDAPVVIDPKVEPEIKPELKNEQPLTPDFLKMSDTEHQITEGARLPENVSNDPEEKRGAGRPKMTDEEREAARERKRAKDRERHKKPTTTKQSEAPANDAGEALAKANAAIIVAGLNMLTSAISAGEYAAPPEVQAGSLAAWTAFMKEENIVFPPWVQVAIISVIHVAPAFSSLKGKERISLSWAKLKEWYILRRVGVR